MDGQRRALDRSERENLRGSLYNQLFPYFLLSLITGHVVGYRAFIISGYRFCRSSNSPRANYLLLIFNAPLAGLAAMWKRFDVRTDCREAKRVDRKDIMIVVADFRK